MEAPENESHVIILSTDNRVLSAHFYDGAFYAKSEVLAMSQIKIWKYNKESK